MRKVNNGHGVELLDAVVQGMLMCSEGSTYAERGQHRLTARRSERKADSYITNKNKCLIVTIFGNMV